MEKEGKERAVGDRKAWLEMQSITEQLRVLRKSAEKVEDGEKRKKFEGFGGMGMGSFGNFGNFKEERKIKPVKGLVLRRDLDKGKEERFESEAEGFFGGGGSGALGIRRGHPLQVAQPFPPRRKSLRQIERGRRSLGIGRKGVGVVDGG